MMRGRSTTALTNMEYSSTSLGQPVLSSSAWQVSALADRQQSSAPNSQIVCRE